MGCVPAPICRQAIAQANAIAPNRNKASDGICGDPAHQARVSDHNSGDAVDPTNDPRNGFDAHAHADMLRIRVLAGQAPWVKYIISNARIFNPSVSPDWRRYRGSNPHTGHAHISIHRSHRASNVVWWVTGQPSVPPTFPRGEDDMFLYWHFNAVFLCFGRWRSAAGLHPDVIHDYHRFASIPLHGKAGDNRSALHNFLIPV